ncbi:SDR family NAD(P)-dependent oxidoreductase [Microbispora sp. RL4-1S]|uniref:SDR family NAD(P)-dependent oxidoreductase n=1 Tax=Microbispora oryzae TaxID=2806554 RepID=A0A940WWJ7_9ACTN|nr:SDR family NAD(P)-dependent oxidoreductase [Microbispora oryzae]MBP2708636.1 SDR family NAD(P)-dependent oxidoreductase [Microbispora oryzae]
MITVITGASDGIGAASALDLAKQGHQLVLVGRTPAKLDAVADRVAAITGSRPDTLPADYAVLDEVRRLGAELLDRYPRIDALVNNAGVMAPKRRITMDGYELMVQVNHLAPFLLTNLLLDRLTASSARVVTTTSRAAKTGRLNPADLSRRNRRWNGWLQYGDTKQANALFTVALAKRGLAATCLHPGVLKTDFASGTFFMKLVMLVPGMGEPPEAGGSRLARLVAGEDAVAHSGRYFHKDAPADVPASMTDMGLAEELWTASLKATGLAVTS